jgi:hypothetical protein
MKKALFFKISIISVITILIFSLVISSCNFEIGDSSLLTEPTVDYSDSLLTISIPRQSKTTKQVNIYRQDVTKYKKENYKNAEILTIGLIMPTNLTDISGGSVYQFQDKMVCKNHLYRYMVRYTDSKGNYHSTKWSNVVTITSDSAYAEDLDDDDLTYSTSDADIKYNEEDYTFTVTGTINLPSVVSNFKDTFEPALLVQLNDDPSTLSVFQLPTNVKNKITNESSSDVIFSIRNILTDDFLNTQIQVVGILGQAIQYKPTSDDSTSTANTAKAAREAESSESSESTATTGSETSETSETTTSETETTNSETTESTEAEEDKQKDVVRVVWTKPMPIKIRGKVNNVITVKSGTDTNGFDYSVPKLSIAH